MSETPPTVSVHVARSKWRGNLPASAKNLTSLVGRRRSSGRSSAGKRRLSLDEKRAQAHAGIAQLKAVLTRPSGGMPLTDQEVADIIAEFDRDGDGELQFDEFAVFWAPVNGAPAPVRRSVGETLVKA